MSLAISGDSPNFTNASLTTPTLTSPTFAGNPTGSVITSGTAVASTSGTSIDFTGIPSWAKRVTIMFSGVSTNNTSSIIVQIGTSGGIETSGYLSGCVANSNGTATTGFIVSTQAATTVNHGAMQISSFGSNSWISSSAIGYSDANGGAAAGGSKTLSATLDRVRITTVSGTATFDAGSINILYE